MRSWAVCLALLALAAVTAADEIQLQKWLMPGECYPMPVQLAAGESQQFQIVAAKGDRRDTRLSSLLRKGDCLARKDGECIQAVDSSEAACREAVETGAVGTYLAGQVSVAEPDIGYVYAVNWRSEPALVDVLVVVEPSGQGAAGFSDSTAVGKYRRQMLERPDAAGVTDDTPLPANSARSPSRKLLQSSSPNPTPPPTSQSDIIQRIENQVSPNVRKWVKIAVIVAIVLICLIVLSCLICLVKCLCWPCCCAARTFK